MYMLLVKIIFLMKHHGGACTLRMFTYDFTCYFPMRTWYVSHKVNALSMTESLTFPTKTQTRWPLQNNPLFPL